jgi:short-subunit dehydrogenase
MNYVLIIGAKSDIAKECAKEFSKNGFDLILASRNVTELEDFKKDINIRYNKDVLLKELDITDFNAHRDFYNSLDIKPKGVIVASGAMYKQEETQNDFIKTLNTINVNFTGVVSILNIIANDFEQRKYGFIIGISSVAGDRGRASNYIYGSSKAAFSSYLSGLRNRLYKTNVSVLTVKPGFVKTKMTEGFDLPKKLTANPDTVANDIYKAYKSGKNMLYTKSIWFLIMLIIKHIPEFIFKKMSI